MLLVKTNDRLDPVTPACKNPPYVYSIKDLEQVREKKLDTATMSSSISFHSENLAASMPDRDTYSGRWLARSNWCRNLDENKLTESKYTAERTPVDYIELKTELKHRV